jgi:hypothetical protein
MDFDRGATIESVRAAGFEGPVRIVDPGDRIAIAAD